MLIAANLFSLSHFYVESFVKRLSKRLNLFSCRIVQDRLEDGDSSEANGNVEQVSAAEELSINDDESE